MLSNRLLLSLLLLNVSFYNFSLNHDQDLDSDKNSEYVILRDECDSNINDEDNCSEDNCSDDGELFSLENILSNSDIKEFYENLSDLEKTDFTLLVKELNSISEDILNKLIVILQKHEQLVDKFKKVNKYDNLDLVITFSNTHLNDFVKSFNNDKFEEFVNSDSINNEEKAEFKSLCKDMQICFKEGSMAILNLFNSFQILRDKYKASTDNNILIVVGFDQDDALPCEYLVI